MNKIFFLTCLNIESSERDPQEPKMINTRCWGWYKEYDDARHDIENNVSDMHECFYKYALIEETGEGTHARPNKITWFMWNRDDERYEECEEPEAAKRTIGFCF